MNYQSTWRWFFVCVWCEVESLSPHMNNTIFHNVPTNLSNHLCYILSFYTCVGPFLGSLFFSVDLCICPYIYIYHTVIITVAVFWVILSGGTSLIMYSPIQESFKYYYLGALRISLSEYIHMHIQQNWLYRLFGGKLTSLQNCLPIPIHCIPFCVLNLSHDIFIYFRSS